MVFAALDQGSVIPLYYQIQQRLLDQILSGALEAGEPVPSEQEIANHLAVSRMTARQALKSLCDLGSMPMGMESAKRIRCSLKTDFPGAICSAVAISPLAGTVSKESAFDRGCRSCAAISSVDESTRRMFSPVWRRKRMCPCAGCR